MSEEIKTVVDDAFANLVRNSDYKYYLSGPMTGHEEFNYPLFRRIKGSLESTGVSVLSPSDVDGGQPPESYTSNSPYKYYLFQSLDLLYKADAVILLPGWYKSKGAQIETSIAQACAMPCFVLSRLTLLENVDIPNEYFRVGNLT